MASTAENFKIAAKKAKSLEAKEKDVTEKKMFVYFDDSGNIKCISPVEDEAQEKAFQRTKLPLKNVYRFITGEVSPSKFIVKKKKGKLNNFVIVERLYEISHVRKLDRFLTEIDQGRVQGAEMEIVVDVKNSSITFRLNNQVRLEFIETIDNLDLASINGLRMLKVYCTTKNDPSMLIEGFDLPVKDLLQGNVIRPYTCDVTNYSLFTRRVFDNYSYTILRGTE